LLVSSGDAATLQFAQLLQSELAKANITMNIKTMLFNDIVTLQQKHQQLGMTLVGWSGRIDPDGNTYDFNYTGRPNNDGSYSNKDVDTLRDEQRQATDDAARKAALRKAEQIYVADDPARAWFRFAVSQMLTSPKLKGLTPYPDQIPRFQFATLSK